MPGCQGVELLLGVWHAPLGVWCGTGPTHYTVCVLVLMGEKGHHHSRDRAPRTGSTLHPSHILGLMTLQLDRKFKLPKMRYKGGALEAHRIRVERKPLVREVREVPDDPVFPLVTKKLAPGAAGAPKPAAAAAGAAAGGSAAAGAQAASGAAPPPPTPSPSSSQPVGGGAGEAPAFRQVGPWRVQGRPAQAVSLDVEVPGVVARAVMEAQGPPQELSEGPSTEVGVGGLPGCLPAAPRTLHMHTLAMCMGQPLAAVGCLSLSGSCACEGMGGREAGCSLP